MKIARALISVSDKTGLVEFARELVGLGVELFSTGGTRIHLEKAGLSVQDVASYTGFPEMMDGRVKTLHPRIFGGILCRRDNPEDIQSARDHEILPIDLVVVNLYPFARTIARPDVNLAMAIENIDIGGPSLVRAAAKNSRFVTIATSPAQYESITHELRKLDGCTSAALRQRLTGEAFEHTAAYDRTIADYFANQACKMDETVAELLTTLPASIELTLRRHQVLRYGENPDQVAGLYEVVGESGPKLTQAVKLHGKELSFNNLLDLNAALTMVSSFSDSACVVLKHNNPCGAAAGGELHHVVHRAMAGDPLSAFGSILAVNQSMDAKTASYLANGNYFIECIIAPGFSPESFEILTTLPKWKNNVRLMRGELIPRDLTRLDMRRVMGGMLVQQADDLRVDTSEWKVVTGDSMDDSLQRELEFAWNMVRFVKSNAIVLVRECSLCGVGAGQMSRVDSVRIAIDKGGDRARGSVLASDAFFPFPDSIEIAAAAGIRAIIQPGGSIKDPEVIAACRVHSIPMIFTGRRHFLH